MCDTYRDIVGCAALIVAMICTQSNVMNILFKVISTMKAMCNEFYIAVPID
jgi:hypothetical protein